MVPPSVETQLRPYQREAVAAVLGARRRGIKRMLVCLPTGAGKTVIFAHLARMARREVLVLAHRDELLEQAREKLERALQGERVVAIEQGARRAPAEARVIVCSIRSLHEARLARVISGRDIGLVIYDECHHAAAEDNMRVLRQLGAFDASWSGTLLGVTATTERGDGKGLDKVFESIVYSRSLRAMIDDGFVVPLRGFRIATATDLNALEAGDRRGAEDFSEQDLAEAVDIEERNALVARSIQELARDRRSIVFCVNVKHAQHLARALNAIGVRAATVHGAMPSELRAKTLADFRAGVPQALTNVGVLTEGFDDPEVSCIAMARPTRSQALYAQCVGRGTRLYPGKSNCLVLDFVDISSLSLCTLPSLFGMPRDLDLQGEDVREASRIWEQIAFDYPGFEVEAGALTLREIQDRAAAFDPLTLRVNEGVRAISHNAWFSLGRFGVGIHFERRPGRIVEMLVLSTRSRGRSWEVSVDGVAKARFSRMEDAVEAADFEIRKLGRHAASSARDGADRRDHAHHARFEALRLEAWNRVAGHGRKRSQTAASADAE